MRKAFISMLAVWALAILAGYAHAGAQKKMADHAQGDEYVPQRGDFTIKTRFTTKDEDGSTTYDSIITYLTDKQGHTDTLVSEALPLDTADWSSDNIGSIEEEDYNFDGIPDLQVCLGPFNAFGNFVYDAFLWDDSQHKFVRIPGYDDIIIYSPTVNASEKQIVSVWRLDNDVEIVKYEWKNGRLVEVERTQEEYDTGYDDETEEEAEEP